MGDTIWSRKKPQKFISDPVVVVTPNKGQKSLGGVSSQTVLSRFWTLQLRSRRGCAMGALHRTLATALGTYRELTPAR